MQQVFSAINYCHNHNIIHRYFHNFQTFSDIKPENLLYERKSSHSMIKVIDFGGSLIFDKNIKSKLTDGFGTVSKVRIYIYIYIAILCCTRSIRTQL